MTGGIPAELGDLSNLEVLSLGRNQLTGSIPPELADLSNLRRLNLWGNRLTGPIPPELTGLANLRELYLEENELTGCIPGGLRTVADHDLQKVGLPYCDLLLSGLTLSPGSLVPAFDPYRTEYSASVGLSPVTMTVDAANDHDATIQFLDESDVVLADADNTLEGFQVEFGGGTAYIKIRVLSQDGQAIHTYVVTNLGNRYDANDNGAIERDEVITAIKDYFGEVITRDEVVEVIKLYFSG